MNNNRTSQKEELDLKENKFKEKCRTEKIKIKEFVAYLTIIIILHA